jgi:hypothetical protein
MNGCSGPALAGWAPHDIIALVRAAQAPAAATPIHGVDQRIDDINFKSSRKIIIRS